MHSSYRRYLQDLPWQGLAVQIWLIVGRFRCRNKSCPRKIFCERLPGVARVYGRQTDRVSEIVRLVGYIAGGRPEQRILIRLSLPTSDDTILRRIRLLAIDASDVIAGLAGAVLDVGLARKVLFVGADTQVESSDLHVVDGQVGYTLLGYLLKTWPRIKKPM